MSTTKLPMACACGEGATEMDRRREEVRRRIGSWREDSLTTVLLFELWWNYSYEIDSIGCDQWFGITLEKWVKEGEEPKRLRIECDSVEDGLCALYLYIAETEPSTEEI